MQLQGSLGDGCPLRSHIINVEVPCRKHSLTHNRPGDAGKVSLLDARAVLAAAQSQRFHFRAKKDKAALRIGKAQRVLEHGGQHVV